MKFTLRIDRERCKGCALCVETCAKAVLKMSRTFNRSGFQYAETVPDKACSGCRRCTDVCPDAAIEIVGEKSVSPAEPGDIEET